MATYTGEPKTQQGVFQHSLEKRPYSPPQLSQYGTLRQITLAVGNHGADDGGSQGNKKTSN